MIFNTLILSSLHVFPIMKFHASPFFASPDPTLPFHQNSRSVNARIEAAGEAPR